MKKEIFGECLGRIEARAKANLYLEVLQKRPDGFHDLFSVFVPIDWADELEFFAMKKNKLVFECTDTAIASDNSVMKAAKTLWPFRKNKNGVQIKLYKKVPYQAGLGSASSDAAAALLWLNQFWECGLKFQDLLVLAEGLGSDVPFFLYHQPCLIEGRGERITPLKRTRPLALLLLKPKNIFIATGWAYAQLAQKKAYTHYEARRTEFLKAYQNGHDEEIARLAFNGFEEILSESCGFIRHCRAILKEAGASGSVLSGSGSALAGIFESFEALEKGLFYFYQKNLKEIFDFKISFL